MESAGDMISYPDKDVGDNEDAGGGVGNKGGVCLRATTAKKQLKSGKQSSVQSALLSLNCTL